ncbi:MAG: hypothetical protein IJC23_04000 [Bacteroidaceae bacterium]|nr:hypothetical protein [Bacteroidaceae bacterium]
MKKSLLSLCMMLLTVASWAQNWTAPTENDYPHSTPVYVQVKVNGEEMLKGAEVAAFIDDECRASSQSAEAQVGDLLCYQLRVWGDTDADLNKTITFKVNYNGLVFKMKKTITFTGETYSEIPLVLNIDLPTGVSMPDPLELEAKLPFSYDLTNDIEFQYEGYDASGALVPYTPLGESEIETELTYSWDFANSSAYFTVENNKLQAVQETPGSYLGLKIKIISDVAELEFLSTFTNVVITQPVVSVTSISCEPNVWDITTDDNLYELEELNAAIIILPEDATNKGYSFEPADEEAAAVFANGMFTDGGTYNINIVSQADNSIYTTVVFNVTVPVDAIRPSQSSFYAITGENLFELITPNVKVYPENATNKAFSFVVNDGDSDAIVDGVATRPGVYNITIQSDENPQVQADVTVTVNEIEAPASITVNVGESFMEQLSGQIQVLPIMETSEFTYTIAPKTDADAEGLDVAEGVALKAGTYTLLVTCTENPKATAEIEVVVLTPVKITFPSNLTLSKFKATELPLTLVEGDNFDPELIEIQINNNNDIMVFGLEPITYYFTSEDKLTWDLLANLIGYYDLQVLYDGEYMLNEDGSEYTPIIVPVEIPFNNAGWDWIYMPTYYELQNEDGSYKSWMNQDENNRIIDLRSQTDLLYNDDTYGLFGSISSMDASSGMYKIKAAYENPEDAMFVSDIEIYWEMINPLIKKGYNWIGFPCEWDITIDQFNTLNEWNNPSDGDKIIGKTGFAEYDAAEGLWLAQEGFTLQAGKGYLYYSNRDDEYELDLIYRPEDMAQVRLPRQAAASRQLNNVWKYDAGAFADNMAVVARIEGLENPENYSIGAFVNGECRGEGSVVSNGRMMISVAGTAGEKVSFRIYNKATGEFADVAETVKYAQTLGSLKAPLALTVPEVTGISSVVAADKVQTEGIYDMNGRRINSMTQSGVYVVKTMEGGKIVTKKVVVK